MKKILALVLALGIILGVGAEVKNVTDYAGEPPIGSKATITDTSDGSATTYGEPPIGS